MLLHFSISRIFRFSKYTVCITGNIDRMLQKLREGFYIYNAVTHKIFS